MIDDTITLSSLLDVVYCKRRWYLHHVEHLNNSDNIFISMGKLQHEYVDENHIEYHEDFVRMTNFQVYSNKYHLVGICDAIDFIYDSFGIYVPFIDSPVRIVPVELKHGRYRICNEYICQLVAQVICLEEMYDCKISNGIIHYVNDNVNYDVFITDKYRQMCFDAIDFVCNYSGDLIRPNYSRKCKGCSMMDDCRPRDICISDYIDRLWSVDDL